MSVGTIGVIGRLGAKAAMGTVRLGGNAAKATGRAALNSATASPGAVGRAAVNIPANIGKTFWNASVQDLGLSSLTIRSGPLLKPPVKVELNEGGSPKLNRKKKPETTTPDVGGRAGGIGRGAAQIVAALKPLSSIEAALDAMDGSLAGMREDIQGLSRANSQGFNNVINTLKSLLPNAFDNLRNQRGKQANVGGVPSNTKQGKGLLESLGGLPKLLSDIFGKAGLIATAIGALSKIGRGVGRGVSTVSRGIARTGRGITNAARETIRGRSNSVRATGRAVGAGSVIPEVVRPIEAPRAVEAARPTVGEAARPVTEPVRDPIRANESVRPVEPVVDPAKPVEPVVDPAKPVEAPRVTETIKPTVTETPKPLVPDADGKVHDPNRINFNEPDGRVTPKPSVDPMEKLKVMEAEVLKATEVPAINASEATPELKPTETVKPIEPDAPKPTLKPDAEVKATEGAKPKSGIRSSGALSKALGRAFIGGAVILEGIAGYEDWSAAYDQYLAGEITPKEYRKKTVEIVGKAAGSLGGGLTIGALVGGGAAAMVSGPAAPITAPIAGIAGGIVGGIAGSMFGGAVGSGVGNKVADVLIGPIDDQDKKLIPRTEGATPVTPALPSAPTAGIPTAPTIEAPEATTVPSVVEVQANRTTTVAANQMIVGSNQVAAQNRTQAPPIVIAPNTNNTTNNTSGGSGGSARPQVGSPRAELSPLDQANLGARIGNAPGQNF